MRAPKLLLRALPLLLATAACSNSPPQLAPIDDATGKVDAVLEFDVYGSDVDGDDLVYRVAVNGEERADLLQQLSSNQAHFRWIPTPSEAGLHDVDFYLSDGVDQTSARIAVTVLDRDDGGTGPVFVSPDRYVLDLATQASIEFTIEVKQDSTTDVTLEITRPIEGARFHGSDATLGAQAYGKLANFFWAPSAEQRRQSQHFLGVRALDGSGREARQDIAILLRGVDAGCTSQPPTIEHTPITSASATGGIDVSANASDAESRVIDVSVFYSLVPQPSESDFRSLRLTDGGGTWRGAIPDPGLAPGAIATITYYLCARDDDDATTVGDPEAGDRCDRLACTPQYTFVASGGAGGLCAPCTSDGQCPPGSRCLDQGGALLCVPDGDSCGGGGGALCDPCETSADCGGPDDLCLVNGETGENFCGVACPPSGDCGAGLICADVGGPPQCVPESLTCQSGGGAGLCEPCETRADCGGERDYCLQANDGSLFCGRDCSSASCPAGYSCYDLSSYEPGLMQCGPESGVCGGGGGGARPPTVGEVLINEVLADPPTGADVNGDGAASSIDDEFVELLNVSAVPLDLGGVTVDDGATDSAVRFTFAPGTVLPPGEVFVIFGGGTPRFFGAGTFVASGGLGLTNGGDAVHLRDATGNLLVSANFGPEAGQDESLTLAPDGVGLSYVRHSQAPGALGAYSPGAQICGNAFPVADNPCGGSAGCGGDRDVEPNDETYLAVCLSSLPAEFEGRLEHEPNSNPPGPDARDFFSFELQSGRTVYAATYPGTAPDVGDTLLRLYDPSGAVVAEHDDNGSGDYYSELRHTAASSGTYLLEVAAYRSVSRVVSGSYVLRVETP